MALLADAKTVRKFAEPEQRGKVPENIPLVLVELRTEPHLETFPKDATKTVIREISVDLTALDAVGDEPRHRGERALENHSTRVERHWRNPRIEPVRDLLKEINPQLCPIGLVGRINVARERISGTTMVGSLR